MLILCLTCRDTAGAERFRSISSVYFRGVNGAIIAYDITNNNSFNNVKEWMVNFDQVLQSKIHSPLLIRSPTNALLSFDLLPASYVSVGGCRCSQVTDRK